MASSISRSTVAVASSAAREMHYKVSHPNSCTKTQSTAIIAGSHAAALNIAANVSCSTNRGGRDQVARPISQRVNGGTGASTMANAVRSSVWHCQ